VELIDERRKVSEVAARWREQYYSSRYGWGQTITGDTGAIHRQLLALPASATSADVAEIIGNDSWAGPSRCHECNELTPRTVQVGQSPGYESHTAELCEGCIRKALALFERPTNTSTAPNTGE